MTIAVAIRTGSAVVFAADSKVTTSGVVGINEDGSPRWLEQTYDNATKIVHDLNQHVMAMVVGHANLGSGSATDFILTWSCHGVPPLSPDQDYSELAVKKLLQSGKVDQATSELDTMGDLSREVYGDVREAIVGEQD